MAGGQAGWGDTPFVVARLGEPASEKLLAHAGGPMLEEDKRAFDEYMQTDLAHTVMLAEQGVLTREQAGLILGALGELVALGPDRWETDPKFDSFLLQVERFLIGRIGEDVAGRMHTGRSRNDHGAAVDRLFHRNRLLVVFEWLLHLQATVLDVAEAHAGTIMPGYTHSQHAQPWTYGHFLMRHLFHFQRDAERLRGAFARTNLGALGGAACSGTSWPVDRRRTAALLGHEGIVLNSNDACSFNRDYPAENAAALTILMSDLGNLAGDLFLFHTWEFGLVEIADGLSGSSSIMPQKKNPHVCERVKGLAGRALGWLPMALGPQRTALSTDLDLRFAGDPIWEASETCWRCCDLTAEAVRTTKVNAGTMRERADINWSTASNLADDIVRLRGLSFRTAHHVVGRLVRLAIEANVPPRQVSPALLDRAADETIGRPLGLTEAEVRRALDAEGFVNSRVTEGSVHPDDVRRQVAAGRDTLADQRAWYDAKRRLIADARAELEEAAAGYAG